MFELRALPLFTLGIHKHPMLDSIAKDSAARRNLKGIKLDLP